MASIYSIIFVYTLWLSKYTVTRRSKENKQILEQFHNSSSPPPLATIHYTHPFFPIYTRLPSHTHSYSFLSSFFFNECTHSARAYNVSSSIMYQTRVDEIPYIPYNRVEITQWREGILWKGDFSLSLF